MNEADLRAVLERTTLSKYQADAYVTLVELGTAPAVEVANACGVPQARIYDVLRELERCGYAETFERGSLHARAREPDEIVSDLETQAEAALEAAEEIDRRWQQPSIENHRVSVVNRFETVVEQAREYIADANTQLLVAATPSQYRTLATDLAAAHDRGVIVKVSLHPPKRDSAEVRGDLSELFEDRVSEARNCALPGSFVLLSDRTGVCFGPEAVFHPSNEYGMLINDYSLGQVFKWFFETSLWEAWEVIYRDRADEPPFRYGSIRQCIRDVEPALEDGREITATVRGRYVNTGRDVELTGVVTETGHAGKGAGDRSTESEVLRLFAHQATVELVVDGERYTVGGWGANLEDIEAEYLVVRSIA